MRPPRVDNAAFGQQPGHRAALVPTLVHCAAAVSDPASAKLSISKFRSGNADHMPTTYSQRCAVRSDSPVPRSTVSGRAGISGVRSCLRLDVAS